MPALARQDLPVIACVTAYNEAETIGAILETLKQVNGITRVQVVDDCSEDATAEIARAAGVKVISLPEKVPVGQAIMHHLEGMEPEAIVLWCDADLVGLEPGHMQTLIDSFREGTRMQVTSSRGVPPNWPGWARNGAVKAFWGWLFGPISGERAILKSDFEAAIALASKLEWAEMMRGYGIVLFLNWYARAYGGGSEVKYFDTLRQRQKYQKWKTGNPVGQMFRQWGEFIRVWMKIRLNAGRIRKLAGL
ncbi:glycosyltransferase family 2 protein [Parvularcula marina]|uniref:Glycosyltransferase n=1 Tax=Parvularcula marina TaxID=2292771 RepID=A0A371RK45_9PROT|nr:glycosyltransferase family 2 protein [Parvularcula marina]RFB05828.1 glycosyltransferase [Parvularcula marina]